MAADLAKDVFLYLTTIGRKTGLPRQIEIWFVEHEGRFFLCSEGRERAGWVQNLMSDPRVEFSVGTRSARESVVPFTPATARVLDDVADAELAHAVRAKFDAKYGWSDGLLVEIAQSA